MLSGTNIKVLPSLRYKLRERIVCFYFINLHGVNDKDNYVNLQNLTHFKIKDDNFLYAYFILGSSFKGYYCESDMPLLELRVN